MLSARRWLMVGVVLMAFMATAAAQERIILVPKPVPGSPFRVADSEDLFGKAYRWFLEGQISWAADSLKKLIAASGFQLLPGNYYVVVANYNEDFSPIGLIHENSDFLDTRFYGLNTNNLYYIFISRKPEAPSFLSVTITEKDSPFVTNLPAFIGLFAPLGVQARPLATGDTWIDVRRFEIPEKFRKNSDLAFIVKSDLSADKFLASTTFDNTARERWSYGIAVAITSRNDVDIVVGDNGQIIIQPKPERDLATFGVVNWHFNEVDTKAKTFGTSLHLFGGARLAPVVEPIAGIGGGVSLGFIDIHLFAALSVEFANQLKTGFAIGEVVNEDVDPFKVKVRAKPRFGIEFKFP